MITMSATAVTTKEVAKMATITTVTVGVTTSKSMGSIWEGDSTGDEEGLQTLMEIVSEGFTGSRTSWMRKSI